jgi:AbrB family looped-hinge helix DNA binding protein
MREMETTMTQKGQVTVPAEVRAQLGLKPRDRVRFELTGDAVILRPATSRIARHHASVPVAGKPLDARQERQAFEEGVAQEVLGEDR